MPSFLDLLNSSDGGDPPSSSASDGVVPLDVLATVKHEGGRRRRRRQRRNLVAGGVALVALAVPALALVGGDGDDHDDVRSAELADAPTSTTERDRPAATTTSTTADPTEVLGVVIERPADEVPGATTTTTAPARPVTTVPTTAPPATDPPLVCADSYDPACGDFSWSPAPSANGAITASAPAEITVAPGETVQFDIVWSDPDATPTFSDDDADGTLLTAACATDAVRYGPWTPPAASGGSGVHHVTYTAPDDGRTEDQVTVQASSRNGDCAYDPYGSEGSVSVLVRIVAP
jgi:hypothetical protein